MASAQGPLEVKDTAIPFTVYKSKSDTLSINTLLRSDSLFKSATTLKDKTHPRDTYWVRLDFKDAHNHLKKDSLWYLQFSNFGFASVFYTENNKIVEKTVGQFQDSQEVQLIGGLSQTPIATKTLFNDRFLYLKVQRVISMELPTKWNFGYTSKTGHLLAKNYTSQADAWATLPMYIFAGICIIMALLTLAIFFYLKKLEFLFYSIYVFWLLVLLSGYELGLYDLLLGNNLLLKYWFYEGVQMIVNSAYIIFVIYYISTKKDYPLLHKLLKFMLLLQIIILVLDTTFVYNNFFIGHIYIINLERVILLSSSVLGLIYLAIYGKDVLPKFIIFGGSFFVLGTIIHFYLSAGSGLLDLKSRYYLMVGCTIDIIVFAYGLAYKIFLEQNQKLHFQKEAFTNKTRALRAQINPHFIFNSLGSIQHLITSDNKVSALKYLTRFSRLIRNILEGSIETNVLLTDEIKMLNDYLELESLRFDGVFNYELSVDESIDPEAIEVPALLVQPFVENAILHGLLNKPGNDKRLKISYKKEGDQILCEVDDNGVGREVTHKNTSIHRSRGVEVTEERLRVLKPAEDTTNKSIEIRDKIDAKGQSLGTLVMIRIPI
ncbi:sensor histidine kinase [Spongiimicrobium sp. 3-5]|uniref:sensor histidine kinase n=1 Tax=Spongiimicrobium sp. 3-5 TaxID=3332596 RepID=UPI00397F9B0F